MSNVSMSSQVDFGQGPACSSSGSCMLRCELQRKPSAHVKADPCQVMLVRVVSGPIRVVPCQVGSVSSCACVVPCQVGPVSMLGGPCRARPWRVRVSLSCRRHSADVGGWQLKEPQLLRLLRRPNTRSTCIPLLSSSRSLSGSAGSG